MTKKESGCIRNISGIVVLGGLAFLAFFILCVSIALINNYSADRQCSDMELSGFDTETRLNTELLLIKEYKCYVNVSGYFLPYDMLEGNLVYILDNER